MSAYLVSDHVIFLVNRCSMSGGATSLAGASIPWSSMEQQVGGGSVASETEYVDWFGGDRVGNFISWSSSAMHHAERSLRL